MAKFQGPTPWTEWGPPQNEDQKRNYLELIRNWPGTPLAERLSSLMGYTEDEAIRYGDANKFGPVYENILIGGRTYLPEAKNLYQQKDLYDPRSQMALEKFGMSTTDSPWLELTKKQIDASKKTSMGQVAGEVASNRINAREVLAQRKGGNTGAAERLASGGIAQDVGARYGVQQQSFQDTQAAIDQERQTKLGIQTIMPGMDLTRGRNAQAIDNQNLANLLSERQQQYGYNLDRWKQAEKIRSADRLANFQSEQG